jgi:hypothetical protein
MIGVWGRLARASLSALAAATVVLGLAGGARADVVNILFVGNSYTHGRYQPVLNYNAGWAGAAGNGVVHDLLCTSATSCGGAEAGPQVTPTSANTPGSSLSQQLTYLQNNPSAQYNEVGPYSGVSGIFLQFTKDAGLTYNVSQVAVSSATLTGYANNTSGSSEAGILPLIENAKYSQVVLQDQSFQPLPTSITVNGQSVPTRGNPSSFQSGVNRLVADIDKADAAAGSPYAKITLYETPPIASMGFTSSNPNAPIFGSSTVAQQGNNPAYAPYVGDKNPIAAMASDLHNAYVGEAATFNASGKSQVSVALAGDAWVTAINQGIAQFNPFLTNEPKGQIDLWDSNPLLACCETPIGYHPSQYGDYLDALVLFGKITGINPETLVGEWNTNSPLYADSASKFLGIDPTIARDLAFAAEDTLLANGPAAPEPGTWAMMIIGFAALGLIRFRGRSRRLLQSVKLAKLQVQRA